MSKFQIGDKIIVKHRGVADCPALRHQEGVVIATRTHSVTIAFFNWTKAHSGNGPSQYPEEVRQYITSNNVWHCDENELELLSERSPTYKRDLICKKVKYLQEKFNNRSKDSDA